MLRDTYLIMANEIRVTFRNPFWVFRGLVQPVIYLVLFGPMLNGVAATRGFPSANAIQFFAPGLLIMNALFSAGFVGFSLQDKVDGGFLERLRVTPISRLALAMGLILVSSIELLCQSAALVACALLFGFRFDVWGGMLLVVLILLIGVTMASTSFTLALITREGGVLAGVTNTFVLPLLILSGVMLPVSFGQPIIQAVARLDPFLYAVNAARALMSGAILDSSVVAAFLIFAALSVATLAVFIRGMREAVA
jgi:ABC-2 type transport system permease protein